MVSGITDAGLSKWVQDYVSDTEEPSFSLVGITLLIDEASGGEVVLGMGEVVQAPEIITNDSEPFLRY